MVGKADFGTVAAVMGSEGIEAADRPKPNVAADRPMFFSELGKKAGARVFAYW